MRIAIIKRNSSWEIVFFQEGREIVLCRCRNLRRAKALLMAPPGTPVPERVIKVLRGSGQKVRAEKAKKYFGL